MTSVMEATADRLSELCAHEKEVMSQSCNAVIKLLTTWKKGYFRKLTLKNIVQCVVATSHFSHTEEDILWLKCPWMQCAGIFSSLCADYCLPAPAMVLKMCMYLHLCHWFFSKVGTEDYSMTFSVGALCLSLCLHPHILSSTLFCLDWNISTTLIDCHKFSFICSCSPQDNL